LKRLLWALAALLLASPAWADIVYVPEDPPGIDPSGYTVGADTVIIGTNSYSAVLTPSTAGTEVRPKVWIGEGAGVVFAGVVPKSHNRFYNITFLGNVDFPANGKHIVFDRCAILGKLNFKDADSSSVRNCTIRGTQLTVCRDLFTGAFADDDTLESCTFTGLSATGGFAIQFGSTDGNRVRRFVRRFNTFNISQTGPSSWTPAKHWLTSNLLSYANKFTVTSTATGYANNEGNFGVLYRDSSHTLVMKRDTIFINNEGATFDSYALYTSGGLGGAYASSLDNWEVDSCYIRTFRGTAIDFHGEVQGMKFRNNIVRSRTGTALAFAFAFQASSSDPYFHHNTFMGQRAVHFGEYANTGGGFSNNILYGTTSAACAESSAVAACSNATPIAISDSNFVYSTTKDSTRAFFYIGGCLSPRAGAWAARSNDQHTYWFKPQFGDTAWATLDARPLLTFELWYQDLIGKYTLGYAGAHNEGYYDFNSQAVMQDPREYELPWSYPIRREDD
jgi:hypothetical protein